MTWRMPQSRSTGQPKDGLYMEKSGSGWLRDNNGKINESRPQGWFVGWAEKTDGKLFSPDWK